MTGESLFSRVFGDEAEVVLFTWMKSTERDVFQSEKVIVTRESVHLFVRQLLISFVSSKFWFFKTLTSFSLHLSMT